MIQLNKGLFLDLDGTIIKTKSGEVHPIDKNDWILIDGVLPAIKRYADRGYVISVVSNQGGIFLGKVLEKDMDDKMNDVRKEIEDYIGTDVNMAYCPYMDGYYRKPNPGMAYHLATQLYIDLRQSIMVGDNTSDFEFATMAGIGAYLHINQFKDNGV